MTNPIGGPVVMTDWLTDLLLPPYAQFTEEVSPPSPLDGDRENVNGLG